MLELHSYRFEYRVSPEEASRSLTGVLARPEWKKIAGDVSTDVVKLHKPMPWWQRRSLEPIFIGHFHREAEWCTLVGRFRMQWDAVIFLIVVFAYLGWRIVDALSQPEEHGGYVAGWRSAELAADFKGIAFMLLLVLILWAFGTNGRKAIVNAIQASI